MHDPWTHLREAFQLAMGNLERKESMMARSHLRAVEHTAETIGRKAEGDERMRAGRIYTAVRKAQHIIDPHKALELLKEAYPAFNVGATAASTPPAPPTNL